MTADCATISGNAKRQPVAIDSCAIVQTAESLPWSSRRTSIFLFVLHGTNESATCCAKLVSAFSNDPHTRPPEATSAVGGSGVNPFLSVGSNLARCAHAAHGIRSCDCALSGRSGNHRGNAQPRWPVVDRPALGGSGGNWRTPVRPRRGAHRSTGRSSRGRRGPRRQPARVGRVARDGGAFRGTGTTGGRGPGLRDPKAGRRRVHAG